MRLPSSVEMRDLVNAGVMGLLDAVTSSSRNVA